MSKRLKIAVVSNNYPKNFAPNHGAFVYNLVQDLYEHCDITVISGLKVHECLKFKEGGYGEEKCQVIRPLTLSLSNKKVGPLDTAKLTNYFAKRSINKALSGLKYKPDLIYCHFLVNAFTALEYSEKNNIPLVVASGESTYGFYDSLTKHEQDKLKRNIKKIICVSQSNIDRLEQRGFEKEKLILVPNAVDYDVFKPLDKLECKKKLGYAEKDFIIGFVGHFIERKGPNRLIQAIQKLNDSSIKLVCVGSGGSLIENEFTKIIPPMPSNQLPEVFNAFDIFVLPTLHEGHCNVIEEAMACGVPVISSKDTSVEEQLKGGKGLLIDPQNIEEISKAIQSLKEDKTLFEDIRKAVIANRGKNSLEQRAELIYKLLENMVRND